MGRRKGPALTLEAVVDAAIEVVSSQGADALGVSKVAAVLGIRPPSIYNHVGPGDALARAVVLRANRLYLSTLKDAVRGVVAPTDQLEVLAETTRRWAHDNEGLYTLMSRVRPQNDHPEFASLLRDLLDIFSRPLAQLGVAREDEIHAIRALRAAIHGFVLLETQQQFQLSDDPNASFDWLVRSVLSGATSSHPRP